MIVPLIIATLISIGLAIDLKKHKERYQRSVNSYKELQKNYSKLNTEWIKRYTELEDTHTILNDYLKEVMDILDNISSEVVLNDLQFVCIMDDLGVKDINDLKNLRGKDNFKFVDTLLTMLKVHQDTVIKVSDIMEGYDGNL